MAKTLKQILDGVKSSKTKTKDILGTKPGVDYSPKAGDERKFADKHHIDQHADRVGNGDDVYNATNVKSYMDTEKSNHHGYKSGEDSKVYEASDVPNANDPNKKKATSDELKAMGVDDSDAKAASDSNMKSLDTLVSGGLPKKKVNEAYDTATPANTIDGHSMLSAYHARHARDHYGTAAIATRQKDHDAAKKHTSAALAHHNADAAHHLASLSHGYSYVSRHDDSIKAHRLSKEANKLSDAAHMHQWQTKEETIAEAKCNMSEAGTMCEVHGMKACTAKVLKEKPVKESIDESQNIGITTHKKYSDDHAGLSQYHHDSALAAADQGNIKIAKEHKNAHVAHHMAEIAHHTALAAHRRGEEDRFDATIAALESSKKAHFATERMVPRLKEDSEQLDELSKSTLANYIGAASMDKSMHAHDIGKINQKAHTKGIDASDKAERDRLNKLHGKRSLGINRAASKLAKEEAEEVNELHVQSYISGAKNKSAEVHKDMNSGSYTVKKMVSGKLAGSSKHDDSVSAHAAAKKHISEDAEQIDELSKDTLKNYKSKAGKDIIDRADSRGMERMLRGSETDRYKKLDTKVKNRAKGITRATDKIEERSMTDSEMNKRERIVKGMKKKLSDFRSRYGNRAKDVMYATATKAAMKEDVDVITESPIPAKSEINNYKHKNVRGLYNFTHIEHPNGNYIQYNHQKLVHYNKKTGESKSFDRTEAGIKGLVKHVAKAHANVKEEFDMTEEKVTNPVTGHYMKNSMHAYEEGHFVGRKGLKTTNPFPKDHPHHEDFNRGVREGSKSVKEGYQKWSQDEKPKRFFQSPKDKDGKTETQKWVEKRKAEREAKANVKEDLAQPLLGSADASKKKKTQSSPAVTPNTLPNFSVDVNTGRNV